MAALGWRRAVGELPLALDGARLGGRRDAVRFARGTSRRLRLAFGLAFRSAHYLGSVPSLHSILATRNVFEAAKERRVKRIVFASSNHVTGGYEGIPPTLHLSGNPRMVTTLDPIRPDSDYGTSKAFGEAVARQYHELYGIESVCLRIGTVLADNDPRKNKRFLKTWLSHDDLVQLVKKSICSENVKFGIYYGVSNNKGRFWDISNAEQELDFHPQDDASSLSMLSRQ